MASSGLCRVCAELRVGSCPQHPEEVLEDPTDFQVKLSLLEEDGRRQHERSINLAIAGSALGLVVGVLLSGALMWAWTYAPPAVVRLVATYLGINEGVWLFVGLLACPVVLGNVGGRSLARRTTPRRFARWTEDLYTYEDVYFDPEVP